DIAGFEPRLRRRAVGDDARDQRTLRFLEAKAFRDLIGHALDLHAEPAAPGRAVFLQLLDDAARQFRRYREANADAAARRRQDRGVDADDLAVHVDERTAGIAAVDRGVGLDVVVIRSRTDIAAARRNDARGDGAAETQRVADRHHPVAD